MNSACIGETDMPTPADSVRDAALALPPEERAALAEQLLSSLDDDAQKQIDAAWVREGEQRVEAFNSGKSRSYPAEQVFRELGGGTSDDGRVS